MTKTEITATQRNNDVISPDQVNMHRDFANTTFQILVAHVGFPQRGAFGLHFSSCTQDVSQIP